MDVLGVPDINLQSILPNIATSLNGTGFLFGAGTSLEAGYPMMGGLTEAVVNGLTASERAVLDEVLSADGKVYDPATASPNIEVLSDLVIAHHVIAPAVRFAALEQRFRALIVDCLHGVAAPNLDHHCRFMEALSKHAFGNTCTVWIFTTNYDPLFELAATECGITLENGFIGTVRRFFDSSAFEHSIGKVTPRQFVPHRKLTVKLVKLHGSLSWVQDGGKIYETHPAAVDAASSRTMVLPRRRKVMDVLENPYDKLFRQTSRVLGNECKYLVSCGFSFSDEHINDALLRPVMESGACRLFALSYVETDGMAAFKARPNFSAGFNDASIASGVAETTRTDLWKFSEFVKIF
jgi:hypothetical protein